MVVVGSCFGAGVGAGLESAASNAQEMAAAMTAATRNERPLVNQARACIKAVYGTAALGAWPTSVFSLPGRTSGEERS